MAVTVSELITGPANLWWKPFTDAAVEPEHPSAAPATGWLDMGATDDGVNLTIAQSFEQITVDQIVDYVMSVPNERTFNVETNFAQPTLERFQVLTNGGTVTTSGTGATASKTFEPVTDIVTNDITYGALLVRGRAPGTGKLRDVLVRRVAVVDDVEFAYRKGDKQMLSVTFTAHYVSPSVAPFAIRDDVSVAGA